MARKGISEAVQRPKTTKNKSEDTAEVAPPKPGCTIYIGRLPHGFCEEELDGYFSQFGQISRLRLSRNKKTGAPKHYGFIEFYHAEVANIVAETMNNYLLFGHLVQCRVVATNQLHADMFKGANRKFTKIPWTKIFAKKYNNRREGQSEEDHAKEMAEVDERIKKVQEKCKSIGMDYDFSTVIRTKIEA